MPTPTRHFYRCRSCCHVVAVDGKLATTWVERTGNAEITTRCVCDGKLELLGRVCRKPGLVLDGERCACDGRCTGAPGPMCDCRCGGANHGTGRVVPVLLDAGGVPRLGVHAGDLAACLARVAEYAAAMEPHRARLREMRAKRSESGRWCATNAELNLAEALGKISALRTHKGRLAAIAKL